MRIIKTMLLAALALGAPAVMADVPPATAPSPTAYAPVQNAPAAPTVLVLPFQQTGDTTSFGWIAPAIQENLLGQVSHSGYFQGLSSNQTVSGADTNAAIQIARSANANVVIFGGYQVVSDQIRIDGFALDVATGRTIGTLEATGQIQDLFKLEDALAAQVGQMLPGPEGSQMPEVTYGAPNAPPAAATQTPDTNAYAAAPYVDNSQAGYGYSPTYYYPAYGYGYPGFYYGSYIIVGGGFHNRCFFPNRGNFPHTFNAPFGRPAGVVTGGLAGHPVGMGMGMGAGRGR
jgi:TolB-like protein